MTGDDIIIYVENLKEFGLMEPSDKGQQAYRIHSENSFAFLYISTEHMKFEIYY